VLLRRTNEFTPLLPAFRQNDFLWLRCCRGFEFKTAKEKVSIALAKIHFCQNTFLKETRRND
jgi:hypothetical protein